MVPAVAKNENGVVTTSSPGFKSSAFRGRSSASVPLAHAMPCFAWASPAMAVSSRGTLGPITNCWDSITAWSAGRTSSLIARYCATRSRSGTFTTSVSESRATKLSDAAGLGNRAQGAVRLLVAGATDGAGRLARRQGEAFAALAHPADAARRHAYHERVRRNVGSHDGARTNERVLAEGDAAHDRRVRADGRAPPHERGAIFVLARHVAAGVHHVGEDARRPAEHVVLEGDALVNRHVVLKLHVVADARAGHHHDVLPEAAVLADDGAGHDMAKMPDLGVFADPGAGVDVARLMDEEVRHLADHLDLELELDDGAEVGRAVLERDLLARHLLDLPLRIHHGRFGQHFGELRSVRAGVHVHAAAHRTRDADEALYPGESGLRRAAREQRRG